jgi:hypothetical protein
MNIVNDKNGLPSDLEFSPEVAALMGVIIDTTGRYI